jgi:hypothetical protein
LRQKWEVVDMEAEAGACTEAQVVVMEIKVEIRALLTGRKCLKKESLARSSYLLMCVLNYRRTGSAK